MTRPPVRMDDIVSLCRRRGFIFQSSEIYGGINGFWDYGPLGAELKRNLKNAWWNDIVQRELPGPDGQPVDVVGLDCTIIMNPKTWVASGHVGGFNDPMIDCRESKARYRADHVVVLGAVEAGARLYAFIQGDEEQEAKAVKALTRYEKREALDAARHVVRPFSAISAEERSRAVGPDAREAGTLTEPRQFNLMFETYCGAVRDDDSKAYLRPETAQGIFVNFWNVIDTSRVKIPFGIAQIGKAFRNEVTPRNFTFRSREFEQMEIEFFIHPDTANEWYAFWRDYRYRWWQSIGLAGSNLQLREHDRDELAHYAKEGAGTSDIEYKFPFTDPGFGELEGIAHRADFDLKAHANACGKGDKLKYFDQAKAERYFPHVIEPSAGADRGVLALLCEAYTPDESRPSKVFMNFNPRMAPIKGGVYPLVNKDGMPEVAERLFRDLRKTWSVEMDEKQAIGKRYARMDEAGTPFCFTIDGETLTANTVTVRHRDTQAQERIAIDQVRTFMSSHIGA
ncbi:MAG: glycine--tRNA ligase [Phycisphaerae bacterium]|nr:glycine--tRNA ligase [Phycisphaerae bacterium]